MYAACAETLCQQKPPINFVYYDEWALLKERELQLLLHHLRTILLGRITHHLALVNWRLTISVRVRSAVGGTLPTTLHQNMSLFVQSASISKDCLHLLGIEIG